MQSYRLVRLRDRPTNWTEVVYKNSFQCDHMDSICSVCIEMWESEYEIRRSVEL